MIHAPFECFRDDTPEIKFNNVFEMSRYWFVRWEKLNLYTVENPESSVKDILESVGVFKDIREIKKCIQNDTQIEDIDDPEKYILYKICKEFVQGHKPIQWSVIQENNLVDMDYSLTGWLARDDDHLFWITMKIINGFDNFNPFRLHMWSFWKNICFMAQNDKALQVFNKQKVN